MLRSLLHISLLSLLSFSVLAPTIFTFFDCKIESIYEIGDEEGKKEAKKEVAEKDLYFQDMSYYTSSFSESIRKYIIFYKISVSKFAPKIQLPPPEALT